MDTTNKVITYLADNFARTTRAGGFVDVGINRSKLRVAVYVREDGSLWKPKSPSDFPQNVKTKMAICASATTKGWKIVSSVGFEFKTKTISHDAMLDAVQSVFHAPLQILFNA